MIEFRWVLYKDKTPDQVRPLGRINLTTHHYQMLQYRFMTDGQYSTWHDITEYVCGE